MPRQKWLPFEGRERLDVFWEEFPEQEKRDVIKLYARMITRVAGISLEIIEMEENNDKANSGRSGW